jgi:hypothetical protein
MAQLLKDCLVFVNAIDVSTHCSAALVQNSREEAEITAFNDRGRRRLSGKSASAITLALFQDLATIDPNLRVGSYEVAVRPTPNDISLTNPEYRLHGLLLGYSPLAGAVGQAASLAAVFQGEVRRHIGSYGDGDYGESRGTYGAL